MSEVNYINPLIKTDYKSFDEWLENHDKQIRDEVIDEYVQKFNSCNPSKKCRDKDCFECVAEQMKGE